MPGSRPGDQENVMTLKAFKQAIRVGTRLTVLEHAIPRYLGTSREVTKVQTNGYWFQTDGKRSWSPHPKASELQFDGTVAVIKCADARYWWTLRILPETPGVPQSDTSVSPVSETTSDTLTTPLTT
jgi:hypothetical protein